MWSSMAFIVSQAFPAPWTIWVQFKDRVGWRITCAFLLSFKNKRANAASSGRALSPVTFPQTSCDKQRGRTGCLQEGRLLAVLRTGTWMKLLFIVLQSLAKMMVFGAVIISTQRIFIVYLLCRICTSKYKIHANPEMKQSLEHSSSKVRVLPILRGSRAGIEVWESAIYK